MALTANREVDRYVDQELRSYPIKGSTHVYKGSLVGLDANGYARPLTAGDQAVGLAYEEANNTSVNDGAEDLRVFTQGDFVHALQGAQRSNIGDAVYASDEETLTFTVTGNSLVGVCVDRPATDQIILRLNPYYWVA